VPLLDRVAQERGPGDAGHLLRDALHPLPSLVGPGDDLLGLYVERGVELPRHQEHVAGRQAQEVLGVRAEVRLALVRVHADAPEDEEPGVLLPAELEHLLEALAVEEGDRQVHSLVGGELPADLEVGLVDLREPGVDDLLVELLLLLEPEDLRRLLGEHTDDPVEHGVVEVGIVDGDRVDRPVERLGEGDPDLEPVEGLGAPVEPDDDGALLGLERVEVPDHERVHRHAAHEPLGHRAQLAVPHRTEAEGAHDDQVVVLALDVLDQRLVVLAVHHPGLEREPGGLGLLPHHLEVRVGDQLQAHRDQRVVNLPLALELVLVPVLLGQRVLHLLEPVVVEPRRVDVAAGQGRAEGAAELHGQVDGAVGVVRVVDRHVDLPEHEGLHWRRRIT
jgi:hypothetical protein